MKKTNVTDYIRHLERMRQDFEANVSSHALRTLLTVIQGY